MGETPLHVDEDKGQENERKGQRIFENGQPARVVNYTYIHNTILCCLPHSNAIPFSSIVHVSCRYIQSLSFFYHLSSNT
jgi:hypothetical protein